MSANRSSTHTLLAGVPLFARLDDRAMKRLARHTLELDVPRGRRLFGPGDPCDGMYALISGGVKLAVAIPPHGEKVIALLGPGATFGETALFLDAPHAMSAETLRDSRLLHVPAASVLDGIQHDPTFARHMLAALSRRVRNLVADMRRTAADSGTQRTVAFLLGQIAADAADGSATFTLPAKKRVIASRLNLTGEHFSRILHDLVSARLIRVEGPAVTVENVQALRAHGCSTGADGEPSGAAGGPLAGTDDEVKQRSREATRV